MPKARRTIRVTLTANGVNLRAGDVKKFLDDVSNDAVLELKEYKSYPGETGYEPPSITVSWDEQV